MKPGDYFTEGRFELVKRRNEHTIEVFFRKVSYEQVIRITKMKISGNTGRILGRKALAGFLAAKESGGVLVRYEPSQNDSLIMKHSNQTQGTMPCDDGETEEIKALTRLGGRGTLYEILRNIYGEQRLTPEQCIASKATLMSTSSVKVNEDSDGNIYFTIVEKDRYIPEAKETGVDSDKPHISIAPGEKVLIVRRDMFTCLSKGHVIESMFADIPVASVHGLENRPVEIQYCRTENKFFMFESDFRENLYDRYDRRNVLKTFVYEGRNWGYAFSTNLEWAERSPLNIAGYNVNQDEDLSDAERHRILDEIIELGVLDPATVKSYLSWYLETLGRQERNWIAEKKWRSDLTYIQQKYTTNYIGKWKGRIRLGKTSC